MYYLFRLIRKIFNIDIENEESVNKNKTRLNYFKRN